MAGKTDIIDYVADNVEGISKRQAQQAVESFVEAVCMHLEKGERVQIPGLGSFAIGERAARTAQARQVLCVHRGDPECRYEGTWS